MQHGGENVAKVLEMITVICMYVVGHKWDIYVGLPLIVQGMSHSPQPDTDKQ